MIKRKRKNTNTIISGRKFTGTLTTYDYKIENIEVIVDAWYSDGLKIKTRIAASDPNFEEYKNYTFYSYASDKMSMAVKFNLSCQSHSKDKLEAEGLRFVRRKMFPGVNRGSFMSTTFHVAKAVLTTIKRKDSPDCMVRFRLRNIVGFEKESIETDSGTVQVERGFLKGKKRVGSLAIVPPKENIADNWHEKASKFLQDIVSIISFLKGKLMDITTEEHYYSNKDEFHFREEIENSRKESFLIPTELGLDYLVKQIVSKYQKENGFADSINALAAVLTMANTYSPYWRVRLLGIVCALDIWGERFFPKERASLRKKLKKFCDKYEHVNIEKYIDDIICTRRKIVHKGGVTEEEAKHYFFMCHQILIDILFAELEWKGNYFSYFGREGVGKRTKLTYPPTC